MSLANTCACSKNRDCPWSHKSISNSDPHPPLYLACFIFLSFFCFLTSLLDSFIPSHHVKASQHQSSQNTSAQDIIDNSLPSHYFETRQEIFITLFVLLSTSMVSTVMDFSCGALDCLPLCTVQYALLCLSTVILFLRVKPVILH